MSVNNREKSPQDMGGLPQESGIIALAKLFNLEIEGLADRSLMKIETNLKNGTRAL